MTDDESDDEPYPFEEYLEDLGRSADFVRKTGEVSGDDIDSALRITIFDMEVVEAVESRQMRSDQFVAVPRVIQERVCHDLEKTPQTFWHFQEELRLTGIAEQPVYDDEWSFETQTELYEEKDSGDRDVRLPDRLPDDALTKFEPGSSIFFAAMDESFTGGTPITILFTEDDLKQIIGGFFGLLVLLEADSDDLITDDMDRDAVK